MQRAARATCTGPESPLSCNSRSGLALKLHDYILKISVVIKLFALLSGMSLPLWGGKHMASPPFTGTLPCPTEHAMIGFYPQVSGKIVLTNILVMRLGFTAQEG